MAPQERRVPMSGCVQAEPSRWRGISRAALVAALGMGLAPNALAQTAMELRGTTDALSQPVRIDPTPTGATVAIPQYQPVSPGALPDDPGVEDGNEASTPTSREPTTSQPATAARPQRGTDTEETDRTPTGTVREGRVDAQDLERNTAATREQERLSAIEGLSRTPEDNPFAPTGIRAGSFILRPSLQQGVEYTTNAAGAAGGGSDVLSETTLRLNAASDWSRHSATLDAFGTYRRSIRGTGFEEFLGGVDAAGSFELGREYRLNTRLGYQRRPEEATSAVELPAVSSRPLRQTLNGAVELEKALGNLRFAATGAAERNTYGDANLTAGGTLSQADRNQTLYIAKLRAGYQISPALQPFVEAEIGRRIYDQRLDSAGYARSADRLAARAGLAVDTGEKLTGEIAAGVVSERFDDTRLGKLSALSIDGSINWSPMRGTTVGLTGTTEIEGTTTAGEAGSVRYAALLSAERQLRANLTARAALGAALRNYVGTSERDLTLSAEASMTWWLNRMAGLTSRVRHERLDSTIAGRDSRTTSIFLGLTLQR